MLPVDALAAVVALFKYLDVGPLLLTNKQFSKLALQVAGKVRISDFTEFGFIIAAENEYYVYSQDRPVRGGGIHSERFANETDFADFVSEAFPHCVIGNLDMDLCCERVMHAITEAAKTIVINDTLTIRVDMQSSITEQDVMDFVGTSRRVTKLITLFPHLHFDDTDLSEIKDFFLRKNIDWVEALWTV